MAEVIDENEVRAGQEGEGYHRQTVEEVKRNICEKMPAGEAKRYTGAGYKTPSKEEMEAIKAYHQRPHSPTP